MPHKELESHPVLTAEAPNGKAVGRPKRMTAEDITPTVGRTALITFELQTPVFIVFLCLPTAARQTPRKWKGPAPPK